MCLDGLNVLDLSDIQLEFIAKSAFYSITAQWQPVLVQFRWIKVIYGVTGVTSTLLSITINSKISLKREKKYNKVSTHVLTDHLL